MAEIGVLRTRYGGSKEGQVVSVAGSRKARVNQEAAQILDAWRRENGLYPKPKRRKKQGAKKRGEKHLEPPRHRTEEKTNAKGEKVLKQYGTTKASKRNPVRLSDGKKHPVTTRFVEPRAPKEDPEK